MNITKKLAAKMVDNINCEGVTIAFLGDSVTQGCFELYQTPNGNMETIFDPEYAYHKYLAQILRFFYPSAPINIINAGISGTTAKLGLERLERDIISHNPDLAVVCFGLNDTLACTIDEYADSVDKILKRLHAADIEVIFMTPNMMSTEINTYTMNAAFMQAANDCTDAQVSGKLSMYLETAKKVCEKNNVKICDCYKRWEILNKNGVKTTELLANRINHPTRKMNWLFAVSLAECIFDM